MKKIFNMLVIAAAVSATCCTAQAQIAGGDIVGFDFGVADGSATNWNVLAPAIFDVATTPGVAVATLADGSVINTSGSTVTGLSLDVSITFVDSFITNNGAEDNVEFPGQPTFPDEALGDWLGFRDIDSDGGGGLFELTISGLDDSLTYDIVVGAANDIDNDRADTIWSVDGGTSQATVAGVAAQSYVTFSGVSTGGDGTLVLTGTAGGNVDPIATELGFVSALQLTAVGGDAVLRGDVNLSGAVDFSDIAPFIAVLSGGGFQAEADTNESGMVDFSDIAPFIAILSGP